MLPRTIRAVPLASSSAASHQCAVPPACAIIRWPSGSGSLSWSKRLGNGQTLHSSRLTVCPARDAPRWGDRERSFFLVALWMDQILCSLDHAAPTPNFRAVLALLSSLAPFSRKMLPSSFHLAAASPTRLLLCAASRPSRDACAQMALIPRSVAMMH
eukprot:6190287-Pleurochrysis_carterae.AAC.2